MPGVVRQPAHADGLVGCLAEARERGRARVCGVCGDGVWEPTSPQLGRVARPPGPARSSRSPASALPAQPARSLVSPPRACPSRRVLPASRTTRRTRPRRFRPPRSGSEWSSVVVCGGLRWSSVASHCRCDGLRLTRTFDSRGGSRRPL